MKKFALTLLAGLTLAATAQAGEDYSAKAPAPAPAPVPTGGWSWFTGGSVGYLQDMNTEMYTLHVGMERKIDQSSHAIYLEVGYASVDGWGFDKPIGSNPATKFDVTNDIIPVTLNYKYENVLTGNLNWYIGAGAGIAFVDTSHNSKNWNGVGDIKDQFEDSEFFAQISTGLVYNVSDSFEVFGGVRYLYMNDDNKFDTYGDDWMFELGVRWNF